MKILLTIMAFTSLLFAEYQKGKIDMHGGKNNYSYDKKSSFKKSSLGLSSFLDTNSSKQNKKKSEK